MQPIVCVIGNTGVGKSQLSIELAKQFNGEVVNADAMQMYIGADTITNKHPLNERQNIPHHLLGTNTWDEVITVQDFEQQALNAIEDIHSRGKLPVVVGGTNYYLQSVLAKNSIISTNEPETRFEFSDEQLQILENKEAVETKLHEVDPLIFNKFHPNDVRRLRRALEIYYETGKSASFIYQQQQTEDSQLSLQKRFKALVVWVVCDRAVLCNRLDSRVDQMVSQGLLTEIEALQIEYKVENHNKGIYQVIGFRQFLPFLTTKLESDFSNGIESMKTETKQYAKKQTRWIKNKLVPMLDKIGCQLTLLDSTNIDLFDDEVTRVSHIVSQWLENPNFDEFIPQDLQHYLVKSTKEFDQSQWERFRCDKCSLARNEEVVLMGSNNWETHVKSSRHKKISRKRQFLTQEPSL